MLSNSIKYSINELDYQDKSVVSKVITRNNVGNVTLFAFDESESLSPHSAPYDALVLILDGRAEIMIGDNFYQLSKDEFIIMPANLMHSVKALEKFKMLLVMLKA